MLKQQTNLTPHKLIPNLKKIEEYRLPIVERMAYLYPLTKGLTLIILTALITIPILINNYYKWYYWLLLSPILINGIICIINTFRWWYYHTRYKAWEYDTGKTPNHFDINEGAPGTCKTLYAGFAVHAMAKWSWQELQYEYWQLLPKIYENKPLAEEEQEVVDAYNFYISNAGIPCLGSNIGYYSKLYHRYAYDLSVEHLKMKERLPYRINGLYDELSTICPTELYLDRQKNKNGSADISDMGKFCRHFGEFRFMACEQDGNNYYIDLRRVNSQILSFQGKTNVLEPKFLKWIFEKLKKKVIKHMSFSQAKHWSKFLIIFEKFIKGVGFFKVKYKKLKKESQSADSKQVIVTIRENDSPEKIVYFPRTMPFKYETRACRNGYKPMKEHIVLKPFEKLRMSREKCLSMLKSSNLVDTTTK